MRKVMAILLGSARYKTFSRLSTIGLTAGLLLLAGGAAAQPPRPCEDRLAEFRTYADLLASSRMRTELEAAQAVAALRRENEALRGQVTTLTEALKSARGQNPGGK